MLKKEIQARASSGRGSCRVVNLCDSRAVVGAYAKGRGSSKQLNLLLKSFSAWSLSSRPLFNRSMGRCNPEPRWSPITWKTNSCPRSSFDRWSNIVSSADWTYGWGAGALGTGGTEAFNWPNAGLPQFNQPEAARWGAEVSSTTGVSYNPNESYFPWKFSWKSKIDSSTIGRVEGTNWLLSTGKERSGQGCP